MLPNWEWRWRRQRKSSGRWLRGRRVEKMVRVVIVACGVKSGGYFKDKFILPIHYMPCIKYFACPC
jgi:hypothetical protein